MKSSVRTSGSCVLATRGRLASPQSLDVRSEDLHGTREGILMRAQSTRYGDVAGRTGNRGASPAPLTAKTLSDEVAYAVNEADTVSDLWEDVRTKDQSLSRNPQRASR